MTEIGDGTRHAFSQRACVFLSEVHNQQDREQVFHKKSMIS